MFDTETAIKRISNMWRRLGVAYEAAARDAMERGLPDKALACARKAEVCFWQATGEQDSLDWRDLGFGRSADEGSPK